MTYSNLCLVVAIVIGYPLCGYTGYRIRRHIMRVRLDKLETHLKNLGYDLCDTPTVKQECKLYDIDYSKEGKQ